MVDITYQIVLSTIQTVSLVIGIIYYLTIMRNNQRSQRLQLETRKAQLYMQLFMRITSEEFAKKSLDLLRWEYDDYNDFIKKYIMIPDSSMHAKWNSMLWHIDGLGFMMSEKLIDPEMVFYFGGGFAQVWHWKKWEPIILEMRKRRGEPEFLKWFEYAAKEMMKIRKEKGIAETPSMPSIPGVINKPDST